MVQDKIFRFQGKTIEELKNLSLEEFSKLANANVRRKIKRGFSEQEKKLLEKLKRKEKNIKTHCRDMVVLPEMIGERIGVYNGKGFVSIYFENEMLGLKIGEMAPTRKIGVTHSGGGAKKTDVRK